MTRKDPSSILPDGRRYEFWEKAPVWERELFVSNTDPNASDENDGSEGKPFRTISRAAAGKGRDSALPVQCLRRFIFAAGTLSVRVSVLRLYMGLFFMIVGEFRFSGQ